MNIPVIDLGHQQDPDSPRVLVPLSRRELFYLANVLGDIEDFSDATGINDSLFNKVVDFTDLVGNSSFSNGAYLTEEFMKRVIEYE